MKQFLYVQAIVSPKDSRTETTMQMGRTDFSFASNGNDGDTFTEAKHITDRS